MLRQCNHKNILALTDSYLTDESLFLVTDYVPGMSVFTMIDETGGVTEKIIASVMKEALQGLAYLHGQGYIHCDVKSDNILVGVNRQVSNNYSNICSMNGSPLVLSKNSAHVTNDGLLFTGENC